MNSCFSDKIDFYGGFLKLGLVLFFQICYNKYNVYESKGWQ